MTNDCFVCLDKTVNRVCTICNCFAHPKCWGKYLRSVTVVTTTIYPDAVTLSCPYSALCPVCKGDINTVKSLTRSDTIFARDKAFEMTIKDMIFSIELSYGEEKYEHCNQMFKYILRNINIIRKSQTFSNAISKKLHELYISNWDKANMFHYQIFGEQISV